jgi:predicted O-methyltransferase YrrM
MSARALPAAAATQTREQRIEALLQELRPKVEATVRQLVERAVDVPEAEEFGAIDFAFRDAGQALVNDLRQARLASRKKGGLFSKACG